MLPRVVLLAYWGTMTPPADVAQPAPDPAAHPAPDPAAPPEDSATLDALGEDGVLARILARLPAADPAQVSVGPGDDAAVSRIRGPLVTTADMLVEGEDFLPAWCDPVRLGIKAAAQNLADVRAMGAAPHGLVISLGAPGTTPVGVLTGIMDGFAAEAHRAGASVLGGDLSGGPCLIVSVTALGTLAGDPVLRSGARAGDAIVLAGTLGRAAAGLDLLLAGFAPEGTPPDTPPGTAPSDTAPDTGGPDSTSAAGDPADRARLAALIEVQRAPRPDYAAAAAIAADAHALIDASDGLAGDLGRVARASGVAAELDRAALTGLAAPLIPAARALGDPEPAARALHWVLTGGEDHGFLAAVDPARIPVGWTRIGTCRAGDGVSLDGEPVADTAFRHFTGDR